jgi:murein DD-endopeptidase MepM/ murein hydrolase activator NlpD
MNAGKPNSEPDTPRQTDSPLTSENRQNQDTAQTNIQMRRIAAVLGVILIGVVIWLGVTGRFKIAAKTVATKTAPVQEAMNLPTLIPLKAYPTLISNAVSEEGIARMALLHTNLAHRLRKEIIQYTVQKGDTVTEIADKFGLQPETIYFSNYNTLLDNPDRLSPGQKLTILPMDGMIYTWSEGDGLNGVARNLKVKPDDIINYPLNGLSMETIGDYSHPNITVGTKLIIPGGTRDYINWSAPVLSRDDPSAGKALGSGYCSKPSSGPVGSGVFVWPTESHTLSGYDYSPKSNHYAIDIGGYTGATVRAVDAGVVVYSGWNSMGYGNEIVIDHGNGWQTLYAHLSQIYVDCAAWVGQGALIGLMGSTGNSSGPHLHFEVMSDSGGRVNPWDYLP